jgi:CspA family cold shock protein
MLTGTIQLLRPDKGFGFIRPLENGPDVFFHRSSVEGEFASLEQGQRVAYDLQEGGERPRAQRVRADRQHGAPRRGATQARTGAFPPGKRPASRAPRRPTPRPGTAERKLAVRPPHRPDLLHGFVTKLHWSEPFGFISADTGGAEIRFEAAVVTGEKRFRELKVGDYVEFAICGTTAGTKSPEADYVREIERVHHFPQTQLSRHPKARRKKPTWRA